MPRKASRSGPSPVQSRYGRNASSPGVYGRATPNSYYSNRNTGNTSSVPISDPREQARVNAQKDLAARRVVYGTDRAVDYGSMGQSALDNALAGLTFARDPQGPGGGSGGSGGRSSGGGGGSAVNDGALQAAFAAAMRAGTNPYDGYGDRLKGMYDDGRINTTYDRFQGDVTGASTTGRNRVSQIGQELKARTGVTAGNIASGFADRRAALQALMQDALGAQSQDVAGMNNILSANGAGSVQAERQPLANFGVASLASNDQAANMFAQSMADRMGLGEALAGDVSQGMSRDEAALLSRIAAQRAAGLQSNADNRAQLDAQLWLKSQDWQNSEQARQDALRLQAAQLGIQI